MVEPLGIVPESQTFRLPLAFENGASRVVFIQSLGAHVRKRFSSGTLPLELEESMDSYKMDARISTLEARNRVLTLAFAGLLCLSIVSLLTLRLGSGAVYAKNNKEDVLRVRELVIVDENGKERLRLSAPLPRPGRNSRWPRRRHCGVGPSNS
jgi:hypothetical protein